MEECEGPLLLHFVSLLSNPQSFQSCCQLPPLNLTSVSKRINMEISSIGGINRRALTSHSSRLIYMRGCFYNCLILVKWTPIVGSFLCHPVSLCVCVSVCVGSCPERECRFDHRAVKTTQDAGHTQKHTDKYARDVSSKHPTFKSVWNKLDFTCWGPGNQPNTSSSSFHSALLKSGNGSIYFKVKQNLKGLLAAYPE